MPDRLSPWMSRCLGALLAALILGQVLPYLGRFPFQPPEDQVLSAESLEAFAQAEFYRRTGEWSGLMIRLAAFPLLLLIVGSGWAIAVEVRWGRTPWRWPARIAFLTAYWLALRVMRLPTTIAGYLLDRAYGLTHLTPLAQVRLLLVFLTLPYVLFLLRKLLVYCHMPLLGRHWWWGTVATLFVLFTVTPELISRSQPYDLVAEYTPLEEGPLRTELEQLVAKAGRRLHFFTVDTSKRSRRANMYFGGRLGEEFVIFSDNILEALSPRELAYILAHELGHHHTQIRMMVIRTGLALASSLLVFWLVHRWNGGGAVPEDRRLQVLMQLALVSAVVALARQPVMCALSRWDERTCDRYGMELTQDPEAFRDAVLGLARLNLTSYDIPAWAYALGATHPTVRQRLEFIDGWQTETPAPRPAARPADTSQRDGLGPAKAAGWPHS